MSSTPQTAPADNARSSYLEPALKSISVNGTGGKGDNTSGTSRAAAPAQPRQINRKASMKFRPIDVCLFGPDRVFRFSPKDPVEVLEELETTKGYGGSSDALGFSTAALLDGRSSNASDKQKDDKPSAIDAWLEAENEIKEEDAMSDVSDDEAEKNEADEKKGREVEDVKENNQNEKENKKVVETELSETRKTSMNDMVDPIQEEDDENDDLSTSSSKSLDLNEIVNDEIESPELEKTPENTKSETADKEGDNRDNANKTPPPTPPPSKVPPKPTKSGTKDSHNHVYDTKDIRSLSNPAKREEHIRENIKKKIDESISMLENSDLGLGLNDRWSGQEQQMDSQQQPEQDAYKKPSHVIDLQELRRISSQGIMQKGSHRAVAWRVLLGYLPNDTSQWEDVLNRDRTLYRNLVAELFVQPDHQQSNSEESMVQAEGRSLRGRGLEKDGVSVRCLSTFLKNTDRKFEKDERRSSSKSQRGLGSANNVLLSEPVSGGKDGPGEQGVEVLPVISDEKDNDNANDGNLSSDGDKKVDDPICRSDEDENKNLKSNSDSTTEKNTETTPDGGDGNSVGGNDVEKHNQTVTDKKETVQKDERPSLEGHRRASVRARSLYDNVRGPGAGLTVEERRKLTSNIEKEKMKGKDAPIPAHNPNSELVPARVREQWKKSGRDASSLASISSSEGPTHMNALLVVDDKGFTPDGSNQKKRITVNDDPLSLDNESRWAQFFENASLLDEIRKDVVRTHPDLHFFLEPEDNLGQRRYAALERILFVWAKLNKGVRYVQGMNEIVGTIYFVLANDFNEDWACEAEADTYFLFNTLMVEMRDIFVPDLDEADTGIQGRISNMMTLLSLHDPEVRCHLDDCGIDASFYSIRWLTTLLSREFLLPDTIRLWDSMFASTHKDNFLRYVCVTMVMIIRDELLKSDFSTCLRLLQSYPATNIDNLLEASRALWIYESQVTLACHKGGISLQQALMAIAPPPAIIMAYGLKGGIALDRSERMRQAGEKGLAVAKGAAKEASNTVATAGKSFFGNAKGLWGEWRSGNNDKKKEYRRTKTN